MTGAPRSGTTLLRNLLIANSALVGTDRESSGLIRFRDFSTFSIGELTDDKWQHLLAQSDGLPNLFDNLAAEFITLKNGIRFVDKVNVTNWRLRYMRRFFPRAKFINIIRDGRDTFCSARRHPNVHQSGSIKKFATYWATCVELPSQTLMPSKLINLRYEDLVREPSAVMQKVMEFIGVNFEGNQISAKYYSEVSSLKKSAVHRNLAKPINTSSVGKWREQLSDSEKLEFFSHAGKILQKWKYVV